MTKRNFQRCAKVWKTHLLAIVLSLFVSIPVLAFIKNDVVLTVILLFVYVMGMYFTGWNDGFRDSRNIGDFHPDMKGAVKVALFSAVLPLVLLVIRVIAYHVSTGETMFLLISDIIYRLYNFYFTGMMGSGSLIVYLIPVFIPSVVYIFGYLLGLRRFDLAEKYLPKIIYKQKKRNDKDKRFR